MADRSDAGLDLPTPNMIAEKEGGIDIKRIAPKAR